MTRGVVFKLNENGLGFIRDRSGHHYAFTFDKIRGYRGERAAELGLKVGSVVSFGVQEDRVCLVNLRRAEAARRQP